MQEHLPPGITIVKCDNLEEWQMDIKILDQNPLYLDQTYRLKFTFSNKYPIGKPHLLSQQPLVSIVCLGSFISFILSLSRPFNYQIILDSDTQSF